LRLDTQRAEWYFCVWRICLFSIEGEYDCRVLLISADIESVRKKWMEQLKKPSVTFAMLKSKEGISFAFMYLSAVLKKRGFRTSLLVAENADDFIKRFSQRPTPVVAFSVTTGLHRYYAQWGACLKRRFDVYTVFGGPHPTYFPDFIHHVGVDAVCVGEGEESFPEFMEGFNEFPGPSEKAIAGFIHKCNGKILDGGIRFPVSDLDKLPSPDWGLCYEANPALGLHHVKSFLATRGCPYHCTYCFNRVWNERYKGKAQTIRVRDPEAVVKEIQAVGLRWPMRLVWFLDANFACNRKWLREFLPLYRQRVGLPFFCKVRPNAVNQQLAEELVQAGCTSVGIGIESGNDEMRKGMLERNISEKQILDACDAFHQRGVLIMSFNMVGLPGETYEMACETLDLNVRSKVDYAMTMMLQPYPSTEIARRAERMGVFNGDFDALSSSYFCPSTIRFENERARKRMVNLQRLMALAVSFPEVRRHLNRLTAMPENSFYLEVFKKYNHMVFHKKFYRAFGLQKRRRDDIGGKSIIWRTLTKLVG